MKDRKDHGLVEVGALAPDPCLFSHHRVSAIASNHVVGLQRLARTTACLVDHTDADAVFILRDRLRRPAKARLNERQFRHALAQDILKTVLRQAIVLLKIIWRDDLTPLEAVPVLACQAPVGHNAGGRHFRWTKALGTNLLDAAPKIEMLKGALRQVLAFGDVVHPHPALNQRARDAALGEIDRQPHTHWPAADDDDLPPRTHNSLPESAWHDAQRQFLHGKRSTSAKGHGAKSQRW